MSVVAALLALALASASEAPAGGTASGRFEDKTWKVKLSGAYAFWAKSRGADDDKDARWIQVAVSNSGFVKEAFDEHYDRERAINSLFVDDETKVVYFELDEKGGYHGLSYYFGPGSGCGYCFSSDVKNTVKAEERPPPGPPRLQGRQLRLRLHARRPDSRRRSGASRSRRTAALPARPSSPMPRLSKRATRSRSTRFWTRRTRSTSRNTKRRAASTTGSPISGRRSTRS